MRQGADRFRRKLNLADVKLIAVRPFQIGVAVLDEYLAFKDTPIGQVELQEMRIGPGIGLQQVHIEVGVGDPYDATPLTDLDGVVIQIALVDVQIIKVVVDIQAVDAYPFDVDILYAVHGRRAPIPLHGNILQLQIQTVRGTDDIAGRGVRPAHLFAGRIEPDNIRDLHVIGTPDINHGVLELRVVHLRRIRVKRKPGDMGIVAFAPQHRAVFVSAGVQLHFAPCEMIMGGRQPRIVDREMGNQRIRGHLMGVVIAERCGDFFPAGPIPVFREGLRQQPVRGMEQQLIPGFGIQVTAVITDGIRIFLQKDKGVLFHIPFVSHSADDEIVLFIGLQCRSHRLIGHVVYLVVAPEIKPEPGRVAVPYQEPAAGQVDIPGADYRLVVILSDNAVMVGHFHRIAFPLAFWLDGVHAPLV